VFLFEKEWVLREKKRKEKKRKESSFTLFEFPLKIEKRVLFVSSLFFERKLRLTRAQQRKEKKRKESEEANRPA
jgi:hypothetical protein